MKAGLGSWSRLDLSSSLKIQDASRQVSQYFEPSVSVALPFPWLRQRYIHHSDHKLFHQARYCWPRSSALNLREWLTSSPILRQTHSLPLLIHLPSSSFLWRISKSVFPSQATMFSLSTWTLAYLGSLEWCLPRAEPQCWWASSFKYFNYKSALQAHPPQPVSQAFFVSSRKNGVLLYFCSFLSARCNNDPVGACFSNLVAFCFFFRIFSYWRFEGFIPWNFQHIMRKACFMVNFSPASLW